MLLSGVAVTIALLVAVLAGQAPPAAKPNWTPAKTPWGHPNLQGMWDSRSGVPLERPEEFGLREFMTEEEAVDRRRRGLDNAASGEDEDENIAESLVKQDERRYSSADKPDDGRPGYRIAGAEYNAFWSADPTRPRMSLRTSRIVDPPDGRLPPLTRDALARWEARHEGRKGRGQTDSWEDRNPMERCLMRPGLAQGEIIGTNQFSVVEIVQDPRNVAIIMPFGYARVIPLNGATHVGPGIRQWNGNSIGRWEGNTLVVETKNFIGKQDGGPVMTVRRPGNFFPGAGDSLKLTERFTPLDADTLEYRYTVDDPRVYVTPYTAVVDFSRDTWNAAGKQDRIFEYACHEHNYGMLNAIRAARADRKQALDEERREAALRVKDIAVKREKLRKWEEANAKR
jgi:hypothetical protein